jgi:hypothetical protein
MCDVVNKNLGGLEDLRGLVNLGTSSSVGKSHSHTKTEVVASCNREKVAVTERHTSVAYTAEP